MIHNRKIKNLCTKTQTTAKEQGKHICHIYEQQKALFFYAEIAYSNQPNRNMIYNSVEKGCKESVCQKQLK